MLPEPISPERRKDVVAHMAAGLLGAFRYFRAHRQAGTGGRTSEPQRSIPKVGRNDPCPCGSGKKYKCDRFGDRQCPFGSAEVALIHTGAIVDFQFPQNSQFL